MIISFSAMRAPSGLVDAKVLVPEREPMSLWLSCPSLRLMTESAMLLLRGA